ncbi:MAG: hypothetical protein EOM26_11620 [Alphaproteobacteria bacterium]|nr:hypothetical protein [Alphaproteobacteria bacterium]
MELIEKNGDKYRNAVDTLSAWIYDLRVSIQKHALTGLFPDNRLECRKPLGKDEIVINPDDPEAVRRVQEFFENETAWGRKKKEAEDWVKQDNDRKKAKAA